MKCCCLLSFALTVGGPALLPFPLRTDAPPKEWKTEEIHAGLPHRWAKGTVHLLAWETTENIGDHVPRLPKTQILVLKRYDEPLEKDRCRWVLAHLYHRPNDKEQPWYKEMVECAPFRSDKPMPKLTDALVFGHKFYQDLPTDKQLAAFVRETGWTPRLGMDYTVDSSNNKVVTRAYATTITAGGVDRAVWKTVLKRDVPTGLFPELKKKTADK